MNDRINDFLNEVCKEIKYKTVHEDIRREIEIHIEETVNDYEQIGYEKERACEIIVSCMGEAEKIGKSFNSVYRLPFNCSFGLAIWAAVVTIIIYLFYPLMYKIENYTIKIQNSTLVIIGAILLFAVGNILYLRRGKLKLSLRDGVGITVGFLVGWGFAICVLMLFSTYVKTGYYPYFADVPIPFVPFSGPMLPKNQLVFGLECFCWWFCIIAYLIAVKNNRKTDKFILLARTPGLNGYLEIDDFYEVNIR